MYNKDYKKGHRKRLREHIVLNSGKSLHDYEILEYILYSAYSRIDVRSIARDLIHSFGSLGKVLNAEFESLKNINGIGNAAISAIFCVKEALVRVTREEVKELPVINNWQKLFSYLKMSIGGISKENFRVIYMNKKYKIIADDLQDTGTVDQTPLYVREIIKKALLIGSTSIVVSHNHPSGDVEPSKNDILLTKQLNKACNSMEIELIDHIIVTYNKYFSFKENRLL
ncbi:RadC family protein [Wolbachia endosymbiont of Pentidionis agamae]|uniref:RadC family protein n=1 Tax=Wolbachia endosymbiont of Pentidionis agamae TaxID=3110435 RepID=UPI002FD72DAA